MLLRRWISTCTIARPSSIFRRYARASRFLGTLTIPQPFDSPEIVLDKHDFSYPDCTHSFFLLLRRRRRRYTAACRAAEHHGSIHRCCTHTTARATRFLPRTTAPTQPRSASCKTSHTPCPCPLRCVVPLQLGSCVCTQRLD